MNKPLDVGFAELHNALFLGGKNFGLKIDLKRHSDIKMQYDLDEKELLVTWGAKTAHIPHSNVAYYIPGPAEDRKLAQTAHPMVAGIASAQVETPFGHVHAGPGRGKSK